MYASLNSGGPGVEEKLASIQVGTIPGRLGQRVRNHLVFHSTGGGHAAAPQYRLDVVLTESLAGTLVKTTGEAASSIYAVDATFRLIDLKDKNKVVLTGTSFARSSFDRFPSIYANVRARDDAEARASSTIAEDIKIRLATFLSRDKA